MRGDTASGGVTKVATLETGLEIRVPLFIKEGEKVKVHTETREFAGRVLTARPGDSAGRRVGVWLRLLDAVANRPIAARSPA